MHADSPPAKPADVQGSLEMELADLKSNRSARLPGGQMSLDSTT
jgi:hypothetical protein